MSPANPNSPSSKIARQQLLADFRAIQSPRILVIGDLILDRYTWGDVPRISPEAPVLVLKADRREVRLGGAASVCGLLRGLGVEVACLGVAGEDEGGQDLLSLLATDGIDIANVYRDPTRMTTVKERFMGRAANRHPHQILRVDSEQTTPLHDDLQERAIADVKSSIKRYDAVLISDYDKGVCTPALVAAVVDSANEANVPVLIDPARVNDYSDYRGATLVTPNRVEAELVSGLKIDSIEQAFRAGHKICDQYGIAAAIVTLDRDGMVLVTADDEQVFPTRPRRVYDITGAGDIVLAALGLGQAAGLSLPSSIQLANVAAGLEVEQVGVVPIPRSDIENELSDETGITQSKLATVDEAAIAAENARRRGQSVVFTNGCFDLLHVGHVTYLQEAAALGDMLIIGMNSDESIRRLKGESRPVIHQQNRAALLAALQCVDHVVVFDDDTPCDLLEKIRPDVLVKGGTYSPDEVVGKEIVESYGGTVCVTSVSVNVSTTKIVEKIRQQDDAE